MSDGVRSNGGKIRLRGCVLLMAVLLGATPVAAGELKDPTRPPSVKAAGAPAAAAAARRTWSLTSILVSPSRRVAVINGKALRVGQRIDGAELVEIQPHAVKFKRGGRVFTVNMSVGNVKEPSSAAGKGATTR